MNTYKIIKKITATTTLAAFLTFGYGSFVAPSYAEAGPRPIRQEQQIHKPHKKHKAFRPMPKQPRPRKHHVVHHHRPLPPPYPRHRHDDHRRHKNRDAIAAALIGIAIGAAVANNSN